ncbi:hypothetical protein [Streptomyces sp. NPDC002619]|uniref:hypothetical protein n=1 Tax=Streptomyces sp. NPDC002619 TaxID=3364655 RepID=UPI003690AC96
MAQRHGTLHVLPPGAEPQEQGLPDGEITETPVLARAALCAFETGVRPPPC